MAVSQKQIAEKLGVSIALVSRVLSGKAAEIGITQAKIEQVLKTADEMGYVPSAAALSLIGKSTRTIGIAVYDFNDPFFGSLIREIQTQAHANNYSLVLTGFLNRNPDRQDIQAFHKHTLDGLIVIGTDLKATWLEEFKNLPIARIGHGSESERSTRISVDEKQAATNLIKHLQDSGRQKLAFITADLPAHQIRRRAMTAAAAELSIEVQEIPTPEHTAFAAGMEGAKVMLERYPQTDGLICATDRVAMGALHALYANRVPVPEKVAVTGFDDIPAASEFIPPITTIKQDVKLMVKQAFDTLLQEGSPASVNFPGKLIVRETT